MKNNITSFNEFLNENIDVFVAQHTEINKAAEAKAAKSFKLASKPITAADLEAEFVHDTVVENGFDWISEYAQRDGTVVGAMLSYYTAWKKEQR